jgi:hypothetical protein
MTSPAPELVATYVVVEVSSEYFLSSNASLTFVVHDQSKIPEEFDSRDELYAEADIDGSAIPEKVYKK